MMEPKIEIHNDHCLNIEKNEVQAILDQITALVTAAILRTTTQSEVTDEAA